MLLMTRSITRLAVGGVLLVGMLGLLLAVGADTSFAGPLREIGKNTKTETLSAIQQLFIVGVVVVFVILFARRLFPLMIVMFFVAGFLGWIVFTPDDALATMRDVFDSFKPGGGGK